MTLGGAKMEVEVITLLEFGRKAKALACLAAQGRKKFGR